MSKKAYSEQEREQVRQNLLTIGLELLSQQGLKNTRLIDIIQEVGISKPFFYTYYTSLAELVLNIIDYEIERLLQIAVEDAARQEITLEEKIHCLFYKVTHSRQYHLFIMTQEEELWVRKHLSQEEFDAFQTRQELFYQQLLSLWNIPQEKCNPKELGNLFLSVVLINNSAAQSLPFFFLEELERTTQTQAKVLSQYLASLVATNK